MKTCSGCGITKSPDDFYAKASSKDGRTGKCKVCVKPYNQDRYAANRQSQIDATMARQAINREVVQPCKMHPCADCGQTYHPFVMDFDHVRGVKTRNVSQLVARCAAPATILAEIAKCDLVCSNCHRIRTWNRNNPSDPIVV